MNHALWRPAWLEIVERQEEILRAVWMRAAGALCSGLPHRCDHPLPASSLAEFLGAEISKIEG